MDRKKRKYCLPETEVNVVPLMDILTSMLFFMVLLLSFSDYSSLFAVSEMLTTSAPSDQKPRFDMAIAITSPRRLEIHLGAIHSLKIINETDLLKYLRKNHFRGNEKEGYKKVLRAPDFKKLAGRLPPYLTRIKQAFPHESKATLVLNDKLNFQDIITLIEKVSALSDDKDPFEITNFLGHQRKIRELFPKVSLQELGGS